MMRCRLPLVWTGGAYDGGAQEKKTPHDSMIDDGASQRPVLPSSRRGAVLAARGGSARPLCGSADPVRAGVAAAAAPGTMAQPALPAARAAAAAAGAGLAVHGRDAFVGGGGGGAGGGPLGGGVLPALLAARLPAPTPAPGCGCGCSLRVRTRPAAAVPGRRVRRHAALGDPRRPASDAGLPGPHTAAGGERARLPPVDGRRLAGLLRNGLRGRTPHQPGVAALPPPGAES